jgi:hypothetical protein
MPPGPVRVTRPDLAFQQLGDIRDLVLTPDQRRRATGNERDPPATARRGGCRRAAPLSPAANRSPRSGEIVTDQPPELARTERSVGDGSFA